MILWDVTRTFPGNEYFRVAGGEGQKALYNISKVCTLLSFNIMGYVVYLRYLFLY